MIKMIVPPGRAMLDRGVYCLWSKLYCAIHGLARQAETGRSVACTESSRVYSKNFQSCRVKDSGMILYTLHSVSEIAEAAYPEADAMQAILTPETLRLSYFTAIRKNLKGHFRTRLPALGRTR